MRPGSKGFFVPDCINAEPLPDKAFKLLIFLLQVSMTGGECRPSYKAMRDALRSAEYGPPSSDATVRKALVLLKRKGWIAKFHKNGPKPMSIFIHTPLRFRPQSRPVPTALVLHLQKEQISQKG